MDEKYLTLKLVISDLPDEQAKEEQKEPAKPRSKRYRSRVEQSPLGASSGSGWDFEVTPELRDSIDSFIRKMPGVDLNKADVRSMGQRLFSLFLKEGPVGDKYRACMEQTSEQSNPKVRLRLAITIVAKDMWKIPWEYLHDGKEFLVRNNHSIIRVIDELPEQQTAYSPIKRLLIAIANPLKNDLFKPFDAQGHLDQLKTRLDLLRGVKTETLMPAVRSSLETKIRDGNFDAIYFLGHGTFSNDDEGQLILEDDNGDIDPLTATEFKEFLTRTPGGKNVRFVYLNSCSTSKTDSANVFAGVAQKLMLQRAVDCAVAMQTNVQQKAALNIAVGFFDELLRGSAPEQALSLARGKALDNHSFGIPVIFSSLGGPEELDKNRIAHLLSASPLESTFGFVLPNFRFGVPIDINDKTEYKLQPEPKYFYPGETFACRDMEAAWAVLRLVTQVGSSDNIRLLTASSDLDEPYTHCFLFGSKSNDIVSTVLKNYSATFRFDYDPSDYPGHWVLRDADNVDVVHKILDPHSRPQGDYEKAEDIGVIEKIVEEDKVFFLFSGLGDRATRGCGLYFYKYWRKILQEFGNGSFKMILKFPGGKLSVPTRISRSKGTEF